MRKNADGGLAADPHKHRDRIDSIALKPNLTSNAVGDSMNSQIATILIVLTILVAAIAAPVMTFMWWKEKRKRTALDEELSVAREAGQRAVEIGKKLFDEKNVLAAKIAQMEQRFRPVVDLDAECAVLNDKIAVWKSEIAQIRASYQEKKAVYDRLLREVAVFDEKLAFAEMGVYEPHFDFTDSEECAPRRARMITTSTL